MKKIHSNMKMLVTIHSTQWENESIAPSPSLFHMMLILEWHIMEKKGHIFQFLIKGHDLFLVATATVKTVNSLKTLGRILESDIHVWLVLSSRHMATNIVHSLHLTATDIIHRSSSQPQIVNRFHLKPQTQCRTSQPETKHMGFTSQPQTKAGVFLTARNSVQLRPGAQNVSQPLGLLLQLTKSVQLIGEIQVLSLEIHHSAPQIQV